MDVGTMPESSRNNKYFLLVVDHSSKFCSAIPMPHQQSPLIKAALWKIWFGVYGIPRQLLSDQAKNMDGKVITDLCKELVIRKRHSSPITHKGTVPQSEPLVPSKPVLQPCVKQEGWISEIGTCYYQRRYFLLTIKRTKA